MKTAKILTRLLVTAALLLPFSSRAANPENPLVLVHGWSGTADYLGFIAYWHGFSSVLDDEGIEHYIASVSSFDTDEVRGQQLNNYIRSLRASTNHKKFNLIGHSQGGATIRKTAHDMPYAISSLTTISTPHLGWKLADWIREKPESTQDRIATLGNLVGNTLGFLSGEGTDNDFEASMYATSTEGRTEFNRRYPSAGVGEGCDVGDGAGGSETGNVGGYTHRYYSYAGHQVSTNWFDVSDLALLATDRAIMDGEENDGFVRVCASKFGRYSGSYNWNHLDEINQLFGLRAEDSADPRYVLVNHAHRLAADGM